jgi:hypothetical protein
MPPFQDAAMLRMLEAQAPAKQTATDAISTLSSRLTNATLLEDRRAAINALRSFAKDYPASVASGSLRGLIACLANDVDDIDTVKPVLETLLGLFNPSKQSVSKLSFGHTKVAILGVVPTTRIYTMLARNTYLPLFDTLEIF